MVPHLYCLFLSIPTIANELLHASTRPLANVGFGFYLSMHSNCLDQETQIDSYWYTIYAVTQA